MEVKIVKAILKKEQVRYIISLLLAMMLVFSISYCAVYAITNTNIYITWYSDAYEVGYWSEAPKTMFTNLSTSFNISTYVNNAVTTWNRAGISSAITTTPSNANIRFYGGTRTQLNAVGFWYTDDMVGLTALDEITNVGTVNNYCTLYEFTKTSASMCNELNTEADNKQLALHEYGHALGWIGHATTTSDVMYKSVNGVTSLTTRDKQQLKQVYDAMN